MKYEISQESLAALVAYPFQVGRPDAGPHIDTAAQRGPGRLVADAAATANLAAIRQWSVDTLGDESASAQMREVNRVAIDRFVERVVDGEAGTTPEVPPGLPPGTHWEFYGDGWHLVVPADVPVDIPGNGSEPISPEDIVACGVQLLRAAEAPLGAILAEELAIAGHRLVEVGLDHLG